MRISRWRSWRRWTIGYELALLVLATLLPFAILGIYWAAQDYRSEQARIQTRALRQAREVSVGVDQFVDDTAALLEALARVPSIKRGEQPQSSQLLAELVERHPYYESLYVVSSDGQVMASGGEDVPPPGNRQTYIRETLRVGQTFITDPIAPRGTGRHVFVVATPLWDETGRPLGIVAASVNLLRLQQGLRRVDLPEHSSVLVIDRTGRIVTRRLDPENWVGRSALSSPVVRAALLQREGITEGDFLDGVHRLSGFSGATRVPWTVIVGIPVEEAYGALRRELYRAVGRIVLVGLVAGGVAWLFSKRLTAPIRRLAAAAQRFSEGDLDHRIRPGGPEELAALGNTLNGMAAALQRQLAELHEARRREHEAGARALAELRRLHSEFIAVAAHELRTPVAVVKSYAELLLRDELKLSPQTRQQALVRLDAVSDRLARLVRSLLGASRIQAGRLEVQREPVDLVALARRVGEDLATHTPTHTIRIATPPDDEPVLALADSERVEDVLVNLVSNATKFSPEHTTIEVRLCNDTSQVLVQVVDQGPGIPEEEQASVFERFRRGRGVAASGVGLGLYIAQAYVEAMGGQIGVQSQVGNGATFWFRLPAAGQEPLAAATRDAPVIPARREVAAA